MVAVIDTNIFVSALLNSAGAPAKIRDRWKNGQFDILVSNPVLEEYAAVLFYLPDISRFDVAFLLAELRAVASKVAIPETLRVCKDSDDDKFLETAVLGGADFVVTKNLKHFPRKAYEGVRIVGVADFLKELEKAFPD